MTGGVGSWIERRARIHPERIALAWGEERITYGDLAGRIRRLGHAFSSFGIGRGDRVGWLGPNHPAFLETLFAASSLGAALAPVNHRLDQEAMAAQLEDASPTLLVTTGAPPGQALPHGRRRSPPRSLRSYRSTEPAAMTTASVSESPALQGFQKVGGTGLEPVTPSLSSYSRGRRRSTNDDCDRRKVTASLAERELEAGGLN